MYKSGTVDASASAGPPPTTEGSFGSQPPGQGRRLSSHHRHFPRSAPQPGSTSQARIARPGRTPGKWGALAVLLLPVLLVAVDGTVLAFALPSISEALSPSGTQLLWMIDIYPLVLAGLLVSMGSLADRIGRRRLLLIGAVGFAAMSAVAAYAPTAGALIASRAALGVFGAMLMPSTLSLLRNIFVDRQDRRLAVAIWAAGFSGGAALGPIVGGFLLEHYWWGSVFLMAVPVLVLLLILAPIFIPESKDPTPGPVDVPSIGLSMLSMAPIVYAIKSIAHDGARSRRRRRLRALP
jgi:DHA2 family multidrug resistance protein-like MFS transporter